MADVYLAVQSNRPGSSLVVLINGEPSTTGYKIDRAGGVDLGAAVFDKTYSGSRGTQGAKLVGATAQNRLSTWMLQAVGSSEDDLQRLLSQLWSLDEDCRRSGGTAFWRSWGSSFLMELEVLDSGVGAPVLEADLWPKHHIAKVPFGLVTPPYMSGPPMDVVDDFSSDSEADYTFDAGAASDLLVTGGQLTVTANPTTEKRLIHTGVGYSYGDVQATIKAIPGSTISSFKAGVVFRRIDASNYLEAYVDDNGVNSRLRIDKVVAGARTNLGTTNLGSRVSNGTAFWVRGRVDGITLTAEFFVSAPTPAFSPTTSLILRMTAADQTVFGNAVGAAGLSWIPQQSAAVIDDFAIEPYWYSSNSGLVMPSNLRLLGSIPGDAPALVEAYISATGGAASPIWAAFGWWPVVGTWNKVWNGDFENAFLTAAGVPQVWSVAAVTNINGAATSITRITTAAKYGTCSGQIVCPATADTGASFRMFGTFRQGVTYTAEAWIHAASAVTNTYIRLGNGAGNDKATSGNTALSTTWQRITVSWTPTNDRNDAHVAINIAAATATTFEIDGVMVYEGTVAPTTPNQTEGRGGFPPLGLIEAENTHGGPVANANFRSGFGSDPALGVVSIVVDPTLLTPDDYATDTVAIEVWARMQLATTVGAAILVAGPLSSAGLTSIYSEEFSSVGKIPVAPSAGSVRRMVRLGVLRLPTNAGRYLLEVDGGGVNSSFDYLVLLPANGRALSPSGRANDATFPKFIPATSEITRRILSDLSGTSKEPATGAPESRGPGLGGSLLEFPPGNVETVVKLSSLVPDDPTSNTNDEQLSHGGTVHFKVTPRWRLGRSR